MKKIVSVLLVLAMVISMVPAVFAAEVSSGTIEAASGKTYTTETWTAESDGVLTVTLSSDKGLGYKTYINGEAQTLGWQGFSLTATASYTLSEGDEVYLELMGRTTSWGYTDSNITYSFDFAADGVVKDAYTISEQTITEDGTHTVTMIDTAEVTIVAITPDEAGYYTITVGEDALIANCGAGSFYIYDWSTVTPSTSLDWLCEEAGYWTETEIQDENYNWITVEQYISGQTLMLGIKSDSETVDVTVTKTADYTKTEVELQTYVNKADVSAYTLPDNAVLGDYIDVTESHSAVLGDDGYYHLDSADGDILLVDMLHLFRLSEALEGGRGVMYAYITDEDGTILEKWDIGAAVVAYEEVCYEVTKTTTSTSTDEDGNEVTTETTTVTNRYYPLTEDLIFFYDDYADSNGVYSFVLGETEYNEDTAWMFACLTMTLAEEEEEETATALYLDPGSDWPSDGAWYAVYYWDTYTDGWTAMADSDSDGIYEGEVPAGYTNVIFTRMNPASSDLSWDNKWNQTVDLTIPTDGSNLFTVENPWNESYSWNATGSWSALASDDEEDDTMAGSGTEDDPYIITSLPFDLTVSFADKDTAWEGLYYQYTAEQDGYISASELEGYVMTGILAELEGWNNLADGYSLQVTAGEAYLFNLYSMAEDNWDCGLTLQYVEAPEAGDDDTGDDETTTPEDSGEWSGTDVEVAADETIDIVYTPETNGTLSISISCDTGWQIDFEDANSMETVWSDTDTSPVSFNLTAGTTYTISIIPYDEADGWSTCDAVMTYELTFTPDETGGEEGGDEEIEYDGTLADGDNYLYMDNTSGEVTMYYNYTATQTGTLYMTVTYLAYDYGWGWNDLTDWLESEFSGSWAEYGITVNGVALENGYYGPVEVTEGDEITVCWYMVDQTASSSEHEMTLNLNYEDYDFPEPGSKEAPYEMSIYAVDNGTNTTVEVAAGASVFYDLYYFYDCTVTVTGEGDFDVLVYSTEYDENYNEVEVVTTYSAVDGVAEFYAGAYQILVEIVNKSDAAATYTVSYYYPVGHANNPEIIKDEGKWTATLEANSNGYYYQWSLTDTEVTGVMTVTVSGESWQYSIDNLSQGNYGDYHYDNEDPVVASESWSVFAGDVFTIWVGTNYDADYNTPAGDVTITITFEEKELVQGVDYPYSYSRYNDDLPTELTVAAGAEAWVELSSFSGTYFEVTGEGAYVIYNGTTYVADENGLVQVMINDYTADVYVGNASESDATYTLSYSWPLGTQNNPEIIEKDGEYSTPTFTAGSYDNYYFQYTATEDGTITVEVLNDSDWQINLWNPVTYASSNAKSNTATSKTVTLKVNAGDVILVYGRTNGGYSSNVEGILSFNFSFEVAEPVEAIELADGDNYVYADNTDGSLTATKYTYTATQSGTLYLTLSGYSYTTSYGTYDATKSQIMNYTVMNVNGEALSGGYYGAIEVTEGDEISITWAVKSVYYKYLYEATLNLSYEGYNPAPGSEVDPIEVSFYDCNVTPVETIEIAAGATAYYTLKNFYSYNIVITGEGAYVIYGETTYTDEDGDGVITLVGDATSMSVQIGNSGTEAAVFTIAGAYPVGSNMNPEVIGEGSYTSVFEEADDSYYFKYTAPCDLDLTITVTADDWMMMILNETNGQAYDAATGDWSYMAGWFDYNTYGTTYTITLELYAGDVLNIGINTYVDSNDWYATTSAGTIKLDVAVAEWYHDDADEDGYCDICGENLNPVTVVYGDLNGDEEADIYDAMLIIQFYNEEIELTEEQLAAADVNGDEEVDIYDAMLIIQFYNEEIESFPVEEE